MPGPEDSHLEQERGPQDRRGEQVSCGEEQNFSKHGVKPGEQRSGRRWGAGKGVYSPARGTQGLAIQLSLTPSPPLTQQSVNSSVPSNGKCTEWRENPELSV